MTTGLTLAGALLVLAIAYLNLRTWYKGSRDVKQLIPFGSWFLIGAMGTVCTGGILGWITGHAPAIANSGGDKASSMVTGTADTSAVAPASLGSLTPGGAGVVFLATVAAVLAFKAYGKVDKKRALGGLFCGSSFCVTAAAASLLDWLPALINEAGDQLTAAVQGSL